jgi:hypothetical protein
MPKMVISEIKKKQRYPRVVSGGHCSVVPHAEKTKNKLNGPKTHKKG